MNKKDEIFYLEGKPSFIKALPIAFQHLLAMIVANITPAIIVVSSLQLDESAKHTIIQYAMLTAGIATLIQLYAPKYLGSRLPIIMGLNFAFVPVMIGVGQNYSFAAVFGSLVFGGIAIIIFGLSILKIRKFFPPLVTGTTVLTMGISLYPVAIDYMAGGAGSVDYGSWKNYLVAFVTVVVVYVISEFGRGYFKLMAMLVGMIVGYLLALSMGMVDFSQLNGATIVAIPKLLPFGIEFNLGAIVTMVIMYLVASVEIIGDLSSLTMGGMDREATSEEITGGIVGNGIIAILSSIFGGMPTATFSQNVGIVSMTKVISKRVICIAGVICVATGFFPIFGVLMSTIPSAVLGGAILSVFAIISINGMKLIAQEPFTMRNSTILGIALAIGVGISQKPEALAHAPVFFKTFFGSSPVIMATLIVFILNLIIPKKTFEQEEEERQIKKK